MYRGNEIIRTSFCFAVCARIRPFLTVGAGKLDESVPKLFVLTSPGDLTSSSDNVTPVRYELPLESRESTCTGQKRTDRRWCYWTSRRSRCFTLRTATAHYDRAWVARRSGESLLRKEILYFFLVIVLGENCQVTPAVTHAVPRSDVTSQGQVSRIVRTGTLGAVSSRLPDPTVKKGGGASGYGK